MVSETKSNNNSNHLLHTLPNVAWSMWKRFKIDHIDRAMWRKTKGIQRFPTLTKMNVHSIESPAIVYNLQRFWLLYRMTGYSIEWPIIHIDRNIYISLGQFS